MSNNGNKISALIVDDEANVRAALRQALERESFEVFEAHSRASTF
jgi:DNA-binding response OmpR family regulator